MTRVNWKVFFENTSTREALWDFVEGDMSLNGLEKFCRFPKECKAEIRKMKKVGVKKSRRNASAALNRETGVDIRIEVGCRK